MVMSPLIKLYNSCDHLLLILPLVLLLAECGAQNVNRAPHLDSGADMSRFSLRENTPVGSSVYTLRGSDPEGSRLRYSISGPHLAVDTSTGVVTLVRPLDREEEDILEVVVSVTDERVGISEANTVSVRREVAILDANDNAPVFHNRPYSLAIPETTPVGSVITMPGTIYITDADGGLNADVSLSCGVNEPDSEACDTFDVSAEKVLEGQFTGVLRLNTPLDFERRRGYSLLLIASDAAANPNERLNSSSRISIEVQDVQDQPPSFLGEPYSASVAEGSKEGTSVLMVRARDGDYGNPRKVKLSLTNDTHGYFRLEQKPEDYESGNGSVATLVTTSMFLDREDPEIIQSGGIYSFQVVAMEMSESDTESQVSTISTVTVVVRDVDDQLPTFSAPSSRVFLSEDASRDSPLPSLSLVVADLDAAAENARFFLRLRQVEGGGPASSVFSVHPSGPITGRSPVVIRVSDPSHLDFDAPDARREFSFDVEAVPLHISTNASDLIPAASRSLVIVQLTDANDNAPMFQSDSMRVRVREDAPPKAQISNITAMDADSGTYGSIRYSVSGFGSEKFRTDPEKGGLFVGECGGRWVTAPQPSTSTPMCFDFEMQMWYSLTLSAEDGGGRVSTANLLVELEDVNDNAPVFEKKEYRRTVREGATSFEPQLFVKATDRDGPDQGGGQVKYEILGDSSGPLAVDPVTGEVRLTHAAISSETPGGRGEFEVLVKATDGGSPALYSDTKLLVRVGVPGNQRPVFKGVTVNGGSTYLKATVKENAPPGTIVITLSATDPDGPDSQLSYAIAGGARDNFIMDSMSGQVTVAPDANLRLLERPEHGGLAGVPEYGVIVIAVDSGSPASETGSATLIINVEDVNDRPPRFPPASATESYVRQVSERVPSGTLLIQLHAEDPDNDALVKYSLVKPASATDHAGLPSTSSSAFDLDTAFRINGTTGELFVSGPLSHQAAAIITLTVEARDLNAVEQVKEQTDQVEVTIYVEAYSDDLPIFSVVSLTPGISGTAFSHDKAYQQLSKYGNVNASNLSATIQVLVPEEREVGSLLLQIGAFDPLLGQSVNHLEKIESSDPENYVSISSPSGHIKLNRPIDFESMEEKAIKLRVKAVADDGSRSSEALIIINVEDINDNNPEFSQEVYKAHIPESARYPEQVITVQAMDKDEVASWGTVTYSASGDGANIFTVDPNTGVVRVAPGATLDHETKPQVDLLVTAIDSGQKNSQSVRGLQRKATAIVIIEILDVNDNPPHFIGGTHPLSEVLSQHDPLLRLKNSGEEIVVFSAVVPENVPVGFVVSSLRATDPDEGPGGIINYDIVNEGEAKGLFQINKSSGDVKTVTALTGKGRSEPYSLVVRASDRGATPLSSDAVLSVLVGDVASNDGVPHFIRPTESEVARIPENSPVGSPVFKVRAADPDDHNTPNGNIYYKFLDDGKSGGDGVAFKINKDTGLITTNQLLDREKKDRYTLILEASDAGEPPQQASRVLDVIVEDVDDHRPIFKRALQEDPLVMHVKEEVEVGTVIGNVSAVDEDKGSNAAIDYRIIYGNERGIFKISRSEKNEGIISTAGRIDCEDTNVHVLVIKCFPPSEFIEYPHKPYDNQEPSEIAVKIIVDDIDDNDPEILNGNITVGVRLNVPIDTPVVRLEARDADSEAGSIHFNLTSVTFSSLSGTSYSVGEPSAAGAVSLSSPAEVFRIGFENGELRTAQSLVPYADGVFTILVTATSASYISNPVVPSMSNATALHLQRQANASLKVFVIRERDLLKFVFSKPPSEVRQNLAIFQQAVEQALLLPYVSLNVYDAQFHSKGDGSLDFGSTSSCFQLVGKESYDLAEMESLLHDPSNAELEKVYNDFGVQDVQRCAPIVARAETSWVQAWVLAIACFIGVASIIAACVLCCPKIGFKRKYKRKMMTSPPPAPPPSILVSTVGLEPDAEWLPGMGPPSTIMHDRHDQFSPYSYHSRR